jgi:hypothetical protein
VRKDKYIYLQRNFKLKSREALEPFSVLLLADSLIGTLGVCRIVGLAESNLSGSEQLSQESECPVRVFPFHARRIL